MTKVAIVTGSNKGIGFGIVKRLLEKFDGVVYLTSRDVGRGKAAVAKLNEFGLKPKYHQLDVTDRASITKFRDHIKEKYGGLDILVNNAAIANAVSLYNSYEECKLTININYFSILTLQELIYPLVRENGRILNISSNAGHLSNVRNKDWIQRLSKKDLTVKDINDFVYWFLEEIRNGTFNYDNLADKGTVACYRVSKVALSAVTMVQQKELQSRNISVNSMNPGFVQTDMTLGAGILNIDQSAETPVYLLLEAPQSIKGSYLWYDGKVVDWFDYEGDFYFKAKHLTAYKK